MDFTLEYEDAIFESFSAFEHIVGGENERKGGKRNENKSYSVLISTHILLKSLEIQTNKKVLFDLRNIKI